MTPKKEYRGRYKEYMTKYYKAMYRKTKKFLISKLGNKCVICGNSKPRMVFHEIHGKPHKTLTFNQVIKLWKNFVPLCSHCHNALHRYTKYKEKMRELEW